MQEPASEWHVYAPKLSTCSEARIEEAGVLLCAGASTRDYSRSTKDLRQARIVEMHYFAGNAVEEIASALEIGERTVKRELQFARLFLKQQMEGKNVKLP